MDKLDLIAEQNERIIYLLESMIEMLADDADEDDDPLMDMDGNIYGINRDDGEVL
jgi:hypothetical protein